MRTFSLILVFWGLVGSGWASIAPHERAGANAVSPAGDTQVAEGRGGTIANVMHALVSAMVGESIARSMDDVDWKMVLHALEFGRAGVPSRWRNPESRNTYTVTLVRAYDASESLCLEYTVEAIIGGKGDRAHSTACRLPDGSWSVSDGH